MPFNLAEFAAAPAGKLRAVDNAALDIFEHAGFAAGAAGVNAQSLDHAMIGIDAKCGIAHAEGGVLAGEFLEASGDVDDTASSAVARGQYLELALIGTVALGAATGVVATESNNAEG